MSDILVEKIVDKLREADIKNIISIDNDWEHKKQDIKLETNLIIFMDRKGINYSNEETDLSNDSITYIKDLLYSDNPKLAKLKEEINKLIGADVPLEISLQSLQKLFDEIKKIFPEINIETVARINIDFSKYEGNSLFILDKNMGGKDNDVIVDSIFKINKNGKAKNDIILIYSSEQIDAYKSSESKIVYLNSKKNIDEKYRYLLVYKMWAIGKSGIFSELLSKVYDILLKSMYGNALYNIIQYKLTAQEKAFKELMSIDTDDLSNTIKDSFIEGDSIVKSLDRIYSNLEDKNEYESINSIYMKSIESIISYEREQIDKIIEGGIGQYNNFRNEQTKGKLKSCNSNSSIYSIVDYSINKYYSDISTGDIFRFKPYGEVDWKYCLLISQSCGCIIRVPKNDINTVDRDIKDMQLLVLDGEKIKGEYSNNDLKSIRGDIWPVKIENDMYVLCATQKLISINDCLLDLCSLSDKGEANINFNYELVKKYKPYHSNRYFSRFKETCFGDNFNSQVQSIFDIYNSRIESIYTELSEEAACTSECILNNRLESEMMEIKSEIHNKVISLKYNIEYYNKKFALERIGRLEPGRTLVIIQDFAYKLSKVGAEPIPAN